MTPGLFSSPQLDEGTPPEPKGTFVDYQTTVVKYSKAIAVTAQEMVRRKGATPPTVGCPSVCRHPSLQIWDLYWREWPAHDASSSQTPAPTSFM